MKTDGTLWPKTAKFKNSLFKIKESVSNSKTKSVRISIAWAESLYIGVQVRLMDGETTAQQIGMSPTASVGEMKKEPALEQIVDYLFEKAMILLSRSLTSFVTNYFKAGVENFAIKYGTRPITNISVDEYHKDGGYVARITVTLTLPAEVFERIKNRIRKEVYARRADTMLKASILRKLIINELKSSTYGISDLLAGTAEAVDKAGGGGAEDRDKERRFGDQNNSKDNTRGAGAVEEYAE